ncbi:hypothetical protein [Carboxylicivirga taeanensis]|uniref:hypothetical protein n=1 Tax=Carboxylicivirga taeanensis TaxID=1416875 RepID=UPI003F6DF3C6
MVEFLDVVLFFWLLINISLIFWFKSNILKIILFAFAYPFITMFMFCLDIPIGGSLDVIGRPTHTDYCYEALIYAMISYNVLVFIVFRYRSKIVSLQRLKINEKGRIWIVLLLLVCAILAYPRAIIGTGPRWNLIPGQWSVVFLAINTLLVLSFTKIKSPSTIVQLLILLLVVKGGERVDSVLYLFIFFSFRRSGNYIKEIRLSLVGKVGLILAALLAISVGYTRIGSGVSLAILIHNIVSLHTVADVVHVYFSAFDNYVNNGVSISPFINHIFSLIPMHPYGGAGSNFCFTNVLIKNMPNLGGGLFYAEGMVLLGKSGIIVYGCLLGIIIKWLMKADNQLRSVIFVLFIALQLRLQWYGLIYIYTPILFTVITIGFLNLLKNNRNSSRSEVPI